MGGGESKAFRGRESMKAIFYPLKKCMEVEKIGRCGLAWKPSSWLSLEK